MRIGLSGLIDTARRLWATGQSAMVDSLRHLSSGRRISSAVDDAAGLAISERLTSRINGSEQGLRNAQDAVGLIQTADGGLGTMQESLQRMRVLAVAAANGTWSAADRETMQAELNGLVEGVDDVVAGTEFNGRSLLDGSVVSERFQVGASAGDVVDLDIARYDSVGLGLRDDGAALVTTLDPGAVAAFVATTTSPTSATTPTSPTSTTTPTIDPATATTVRRNKNGKVIGGGQTPAPAPASTTAPTTASTTAPTAETSSAPVGWAISVLDPDAAREAIEVLDDALWSVSRGRGDLGAVQNRLERSIAVSSVMGDNLLAARSRLVDVDVAKEVSTLVRRQILDQAGVAVMAQARAGARRSMEALLVGL